MTEELNKILSRPVRVWWAQRRGADWILHNQKPEYTDASFPVLKLNDSNPNLAAALKVAVEFLKTIETGIVQSLDTALAAGYDAKGTARMAQAEILRVLKEEHGNQ
jgi:K+-transporting ATPase c subunit